MFPFARASHLGYLFLTHSHFWQPMFSFGEDWKMVLGDTPPTPPLPPPSLPLMVGGSGTPSSTGSCSKARGCAPGCWSQPSRAESASSREIVFCFFFVAGCSANGPLNLRFPVMLSVFYSMVFVLLLFLVFSLVFSGWVPLNPQV